MVTKLGGRGELGEAAHVGGELEGGGGGGCKGGSVYYQENDGT